MSVRGAAVWAMGGQYAAFVIQFIASVVIARFFLLPAEVGLFSLAFSITALLAALQDFGLTRYIVGAKDLRPADIRASFSVALLFGLLAALAVAAVAPGAAAFYGDRQLVPLLLIISGTFLMIPFWIVPGALLQREMNFRAVAVVGVGAALANATVSILLAAHGHSAQALAWGALAQQAARALLSHYHAGRAHIYRPTLRGLVPVLRFGSGISLLSVSGTIGGRAPELIIGRLVSFAAVGLWGRAIGLADQLRALIAGAIGSVFYPAFARLRDQGEDLAPPYLQVVAAYSAVTWPAMLFLSAAALPLVLMLYGQNWAGVAPLLTLIALSELALAAIPLQMELPILLGRMRLLLALNLVDTALSVGLLLLAALHSLEAAAASRIAYTAAWWILYASLLRSLIGLSWRALADIYWRSLAVSLACVAPLLGAYAWGVPAGDFPVPLLIACAAAGGLMWFGALFLVRHPAREEVARFTDLLLTSLPSRRPAAPAE